MYTCFSSQSKTNTAGKHDDKITAKMHGLVLNLEK